MYFTSYNPPVVGAECRDVGLQQNNPVQIAASEGKRLWGDAVKIDLLLSIGTGRSERSPEGPTTWKLLPAWVKPLFQNLMNDMNGEKIWDQFLTNADEHLKSRSMRLNVVFEDSTEPTLDDVSKIDSMQAEAASYNFPKSTIESSLGRVCQLEEVAHRFLASLFFFEVSSISEVTREVAMVDGAIRCCLDDNSQALRLLLGRIDWFVCQNSKVPVPSGTHDAIRAEGCLLEIKHAFSHNMLGGDDGINIDVLFTNGLSLPISGYPASVKVRHHPPRKENHHF